MITPSFGLTATERVLPRLALDFTKASLDPRITFTRSGNTATRINGSGYIESVLTDIPRFDYTLNTGGECKGLLIEEARTNRCLYSNDFSNAAWVKTRCTAALTAIGPDNASNSASTITATDNNAYAQQLFTLASATRIGSLFLKRRTGTGNVYLSQGETTGPTLVTNGDFAGGTTTGWQFVICTGDASTNQLVVTASGASPNIRQTLTTVAGKVYRASINFVARSAAKNVFFNIGTSTTGSQLGTATLTTAGTYKFYFVATGTTTYLSVLGNSAYVSGDTFTVDDISVIQVAETQATLTSSWARFTTTAGSIVDPAFIVRIETSGDAVDAYCAQLEDGAFATSAIPTTTTALTRNADVATITGTNFSSFWQAGKGGALVRAIPSTVSGTRPLIQFDDATADNIIALRGNTTNPELYIRSGGVDQATIDAGTISASAYSLAGWWQTNFCAARKDNGARVEDLTATIPTVTQARLGSDGTNYLNGHLATINYYDQFSGQIYNRRKNKAVFTVV